MAAGAKRILTAGLIDPQTVGGATGQRGGFNASTSLQRLIESGRYWRALASDKPHARAIHDWMPSEVLPAISKDGVPAAASPTPFQRAAMARIGRPLLAYRAVLCDSLAAFLGRS